VNSPLISIIVPTYNSSQFLDACLQSIKNQTYKNTELIVVDNHSTDKTKEIAQKYTTKVFTKGPERSAQRNFGAQRSNGQYLLFIDSDMELSENVVKNCIEKITKDQTLIGIIIPEESFGEGFWAQCKKLERSFYVGVDWMEAARFFDKSAYEQIGGYDENLISGEDWDLSQRIELFGKIDRIDDFIYHNEGKLSLKDTLRKKFYYAQQFARYKNKNPNEKKVKSQTSVLIRYNLFFSQPSKLLRNPLLALGMLFMKTSEFSISLIGLLIAKRRRIKKMEVINRMSIEDYAELAPQYYSNNIPSLLRKYLDSRQYNSILDCGCGDGNLLQALENAGYLKNHTVHAIDLSKKRINLVKDINTDIIANVDNAEELNTVQSKSIDFFISTQVIEHVDQIKMLRSIKRVVKKGGIIYLSTVFKKRYGWYFYRNDIGWVIDPTHLREYRDDSELFDFIEKDTFEILEAKKTLLSFPVIDFFVKRLPIEDRELFHNPYLQLIRNIRIPIIGYYNWELVLQKQ